MAIKGKGRTRSRQVTRAPRREVVEVRRPILSRRWFQILSAFVVGILAMMFWVWVTNGLRESSLSERTRTDEAARLERTRRVVQAWQAVVVAEVGTIGTITPGMPPALLPEAAAVIDRRASGKASPEAAGVLNEAERALSDAISTLEGYQLPEEIRGKGFRLADTNYLLNSKSKMVDGLKLYVRSVDLAGKAVDTAGKPGERLAVIATRLRDQAQALFSDGFTDLDQARAGVGLSEPLGG